MEASSLSIRFFSLQRFDVIAEITLVANVHGVSLAPLNILSDIHAANARRNRLLNVGYSEPVPCRFRAIDLHVQIEPLRDSFRKQRSYLRQT